MAKVGLIMGSKSDFDIVKESIDTLKSFGVECDVIVSSAHRTPEQTVEWTKAAKSKGISVIIAFAGAAAHLAGVIASKTNLPVIAVPVASTTLGGLDSLLSSVQMPSGIPVATMAIGKAGAKNAAIYACQIIALHDAVLYEKLELYRKEMADKIAKDNEALKSLIG